MVLQMQNASSLELIAREFVRQYYTVLHNRPQELYKFFGSESTYKHGRHTAIGQANIHKTVMAIGFKECWARIFSVEPQELKGSNVLILVFGELHNNKKSMGTFTQHIVLAPFRNAVNSYVKSDVLRYHDEVFGNRRGFKEMPVNTNENPAPASEKAVSTTSPRPEAKTATLEMETDLVLGPLTAEEPMTAQLREMGEPVLVQEDDTDIGTSSSPGPVNGLHDGPMPVQEDVDASTSSSPAHDTVLANELAADSTLEVKEAKSQPEPEETASPKTIEDPAPASSEKAAATTSPRSATMEIETDIVLAEQPAKEAPQLMEMRGPVLVQEDVDAVIETSSSPGRDTGSVNELRADSSEMKEAGAPLEALPQAEEQLVLNPVPSQKANEDAAPTAAENGPQEMNNNNKRKNNKKKKVVRKEAKDIESVPTRRCLSPDSGTDGGPMPVQEDVGVGAEPTASPGRDNQILLESRPEPEQEADPETIEDPVPVAPETVTQEIETDIVLAEQTAEEPRLMGPPPLREMGGPPAQEDVDAVNETSSSPCRSTGSVNELRAVSSEKKEADVPSLQEGTEVEKAQLKDVATQDSSTKKPCAIVAAKSPSPNHQAVKSTAHKAVAPQPPVHRDPRPAQGGKKGTVGYQVFIGNIPDAVAEAELQRFFEQFGTVLSVRIRAGNRGGSNFGFVEFADCSAPVQRIINTRVKFRDNLRLNVQETHSVRSARLTKTAGIQVKAENHKAAEPAITAVDEENTEDSTESWTVVCRKKSSRQQKMKPLQQISGHSPHLRKDSRLEDSQISSLENSKITSAEPKMGPQKEVAAATTSPSRAQVVGNIQNATSRGEVTPTQQKAGGEVTSTPQRPGDRRPLHKATGQVVEDERELFVGNIPQKVNEAELKQFFGEYGTVLRVVIKISATKTNFGFVTFQDCGTVSKILNDAPIKIHDRWRLNVEKVKYGRV